MSKHIDGTLCPPGTHTVAKLRCSSCKIACGSWTESPTPCSGGVRPDGSDVVFAEGAKPRLVLLRKVKGGYADIEPPGWANSWRAWWPGDGFGEWCGMKYYWIGYGIVDVCAYEFSSKSVEELNRE